MEAVGLVLGVASLASLFSTCIGCFELVQHGRYLGRDYLLLETKFENLKLRFLTWGRACGLMNHDGSESIFQDEAAQRIERTLLIMLHMFTDAKKLKKRYGLKSLEEGQHHALMTISTPPMGSLLHWRPVITNDLWQRFQEFKKKMDKTRKQTSLTSSVRWAIEDKRKFSELIQDLRDLVSDLEGMTTHPEVERLQQTMIRQELASISDIGTLQNIEDARVATFDVVSDAASLRLSQLSERRRLQPQTAEATSSSGVESTLSSEDNWTVLPEAPEDHLMAGEESQYQILHTVFCHEEQSHRIFHEVPSYGDITNSDESEWTRLDLAHPAQEEATCHLRGRRRISNLNAYLKHNNYLLFVVLREYRCCDPSNSHGHPEPVVLKESIHMLSEKLCAALQRINQHLENRILARLLKFEVGTDLSSPYLWFYAAGSQFRIGAERLEEDDRRLIKVLEDFIHDSMGDEYSQVKSLLSKNAIEWKYLNYLFLPGQIAVTLRAAREPDLSPTDLEDEDLDQAYEQIAWPRFREDENKSPIFEYDAQYWDFDGAPRRILRACQIRRAMIMSPEDSILPIKDLSIIPMAFAGERVEERLRKRGSMYWNFRIRAYVSYSGPTWDSHEYLHENRFMIDFLYAPRTIAEANRRQIEGLEPEQSRPPQGSSLLLLPPYIYGFDLHGGNWLRLHVSNISSVCWDEQAIKKLERVESGSSSLQLLVAMAQASCKMQPQSRRVAKTIFLFHGDPGTGKTLAAESLAEHVERPLYVINFVEAGTDVAKMESCLRDAFDRARAWKCVLLLEHAVTAFQGRSREYNSLQNAIVVLFLRLIEFSEGILILTTDRVGVLDDRIRSAISLAVEFKGPGFEQRLGIWRSFIGEIDFPGTTLFRDDDEPWYNLDEVARFEINSRKIRHILISAQQLASHRKRRLSWDIIHEVIGQYMSSSVGTNEERQQTDAEMGRLKIKPAADPRDTVE